MCFVIQVWSKFELIDLFTRFYLALVLSAISVQLKIINLLKFFVKPKENVSVFFSKHYFIRTIVFWFAFEFFVVVRGVIRLLEFCYCRRSVSLFICSSPNKKVELYLIEVVTEIIQYFCSIKTEHQANC